MQTEFQEYKKQYFPLNNIQREPKNNHIKVNKKGFIVKIIEFSTKSQWNIWKQNFLLEIEHQQQLNQQFPNHIVQILDWSLETRSSQIFIYITYNCSQNSKSLYQFLECALMSVEQKKEFAQQILEIAYILETSKIQHRNIKLSNFIISENKIQLTDFGSARTHYQIYTKQSNTSIERLKQCSTIFYNCPEILQIISEDNIDFQDQDWKKLLQNQQQKGLILTRNDNWGISIVLLQLLNYKIDITGDIKSFYGYNISLLEEEIKQIKQSNPQLTVLVETIKRLSLGNISAAESLQYFLNQSHQKKIKFKELQKQQRPDNVEEILLSKNINIQTAIDFLYLSKEQIEDLEQCYDSENDNQIGKRIQPIKQEYKQIKQGNLEQVHDQKSQFSDSQSFLVFSPKGTESHLLGENQLQVIVNENNPNSRIKQDTSTKYTLKKMQQSDKLGQLNKTKDKGLACQLQKQNLQIIQNYNEKLNELEESSSVSVQKLKKISSNNPSIQTITQLTRLNQYQSGSFQSTSKITSQHDLLNYSQTQANFKNEIDDSNNDNDIPRYIQHQKTFQNEQQIFPLQYIADDVDDELVNFEKFASINFQSSINKAFNVVPFENKQQNQEQEKTKVVKFHFQTEQSGNIQQRQDVQLIDIEKFNDIERVKINQQQQQHELNVLKDFNELSKNEMKQQVLQQSRLSVSETEELTQHQIVNNQQNLQQKTQVAIKQDGNLQILNQSKTTNIEKQHSDKELKYQQLNKSVLSQINKDENQNQLNQQVELKKEKFKNQTQFDEYEQDKSHLQKIQNFSEPQQNFLGQYEMQSNNSSKNQIDQTSTEKISNQTQYVQFQNKKQELHNGQDYQAQLNLKVISQSQKSLDQVASNELNKEQDQQAQLNSEFQSGKQFKNQLNQVTPSKLNTEKDQQASLNQEVQNDNQSQKQLNHVTLIKLRNEQDELAQLNSEVYNGIEPQKKMNLGILNELNDDGKLKKQLNPLGQNTNQPQKQLNRVNEILLNNDGNQQTQQNSKSPTANKIQQPLNKTTITELNTDIKHETKLNKQDQYLNQTQKQLNLASVNKLENDETQKSQLNSKNQTTTLSQQQPNETILRQLKQEKNNENFAIQKENNQTQEFEEKKKLEEIDNYEKLRCRKEKLTENTLTVQIKLNKILKPNNGSEILFDDELKYLENEELNQYLNFLQSLPEMHKLENVQKEIIAQQEQLIEQNFKLQKKLTSENNGFNSLKSSQIELLNFPFLENYLEILEDKLQQLEKSQSQAELKETIQEQIKLINQFYEAQLPVIDQSEKVYPFDQINAADKEETMILTKQFINVSNLGQFSRLNSNDNNNQLPEKGEQHFDEEQAPLLPSKYQLEPSITQKKQENNEKINQVEINLQQKLGELDDFEIWSTNPIIRRFQVWKKTQSLCYEVPQDLQFTMENRKKMEDKKKLYGGYSKKEKPHGLGILMKKPYGSIYEGIFMEGTFIYGLVLELNEKNLLQRYVGYYHKEKEVKHGIAEISWFSEMKQRMFEIEEQYKGPIIFGQLTGLGTKINFIKGWKYIGNWSKSKKSGKGSTFLLNKNNEDQLKYEGTFQEDKPHGSGKCFYDKELYEEGEYFQGKKTGEHKLYLHEKYQKSIFY